MAKKLIVKENAKTTTALPRFVGSILTRKDYSSIKRYLEASRAGLDFMREVATEESGLDADRVNLAVSSIADCLSPLGTAACEEFESATLLRNEHPAYGAALHAIESVDRVTEPVVENAKTA